MSKKTFMATMIITAFLVSLVTGMQAAEVAKANPFFIYKTIDPIPGTIPINITMLSPQNNTEYFSDKVNISFNVSRPRLGTCETAIIGVEYTLDSETVEAFSIWVKNSGGGESGMSSRAVPEFDTTFVSPPLESGNHSLTIYAEAVVYAGNMTVFFPNCSSTTFFEVSAQPISTQIPPPSSTPSPTPAQIPVPRQPTIYIASPANSTIYEIGNILLNFTITKPDTWESSVAISEIQYKLDPVFNGDFVTETSGWTDIMPVQSSERTQQYSLTVKNASYGNHSLMVRVTMEFPGGYVTNGVYAFFSVIPADPSPNESSSPSPTQQPITEPSQTPDRPQIKDFAPVLIPASMIFLGIIAVGLLVYFSKRRGNK